MVFQKDFENDQYRLNLSQDRFKLDIQQYRTFLCIKRNEEEVVKNEQRAALYLLHLGIYGALDFGDLQRPHQF